MRRLGLARGDLALAPQLLDQGLAVALERRVLLRLDPRLLRRLGDDGVELALRAEAERDRILGLDVGDVPVAAVADRGDGGAGGADQLADLAVGNLGMVADYPGNAVGLVLALRHRRVARAAGPPGRGGLLV